jgi:hypothetical protein
LPVKYSRHHQRHEERVGDGHVVADQDRATLARHALDAFDSRAAEQLHEGTEQ